MSAARINGRARFRGAQVPLSPVAALTRDRIAERRAELEEHAPAAIDLAARVLARMHEELSGRLVELAADRTPRYRRGQLGGEHGLPVEDLVLLAQRAPAEVAAGLAVLLAAIGYRLEPLGDAVKSVGSEGADVARSAGRLTAAVLEAIEDGDVSAEEADRLAGELAEHKRELAELEAAFEKARRAS